MAGETILIVEDEGILAANFHSMLSEAGYKPAAPVPTGEEAILAAAELKPDLILMDIRLSGEMDGITAAERIGATSNIPVIFLTGHAEDAMIQAAKAVGPYGYLVKPVSERKLSATIEMALQRHALDSHLKISRQLLEESEERYRSLFQNNHAVMLLIDPDTGAISDANPAACAYYGCSREALLKRKIDEINTLTREQVHAEMALARAEKRNHFFFQHRLADGRIRDVEVFSGPIRIKGKALLYSIVHDITERRLAEVEKTELEAQNRQLQKAESLGRMAGAIAHHFNNQLQAVMGYIDLAVNELPQGSGAAECLSRAMTAAHKAAEVSRQMLIYLGQTPVQQNSMDMCRVCQDSIPLLRAALLETIRLETDLPSPGPTIIGNINQIHQLLTNLVTNAREAIGAGSGTVRIAVKKVTVSEIPAAHCFPVGCQKRDCDHVCLEVSDSGQGLADKDIEKIFDPFFTSKFTGRGLGLPVVLGIVRAHHGMIAVESDVGRGSIFRVFFPMAKPRGV